MSWLIVLDVRMVVMAYAGSLRAPSPAWALLSRSWTPICAAIALRSIAVMDEATLLRALEVYEVERLDFADAYLVAVAEATGVGTVMSFDRGIDRVATVSRIEP
jgi:predicted nucleic acid-binding protein